MKPAELDLRAHPEGACFSTWTTPDSWKVRRMDWPQPVPSEARGSLVFAGGRGDFIEKYLEPLHHWHGRGWNVASFDWRGQGESRGDIVGGHLDSFDPLVADGAALLSDWSAGTPLPHVAVGHSMGGHLLLRILAEHRPKLAAAILVAPMLGINTYPVPEWAGRITARNLTRMGFSRQPAWRDPGEGTTGGRIRQANLTSCDRRFADEQYWKKKEPGFELGAPSWGWLNAGFESNARLTPEALRQVETPVLLLGTERDRLVSAEAIRRAATLLPRAELYMVSEGAHELLRERDEFRLPALAAIDEFLDRHARL